MKKILFLICFLSAVFSAYAQNFSNWTGTGNWSNNANWSSGTGYGQLQFQGAGNATNCVNDVNGMSQWRLFFNGSVAYNLTGSGSVNLFDFGGQNSWVLSDASANQTINFPINFNDGGARTSWITARGTGGLTFNGNIGTGGGVTALRVANTNAASSVAINTLSGSKPLIIGRDNVDANQANTRVTLTGNSSGGYSGAVFVHAGTLFVNGTTAASSAVSVSAGNGATLAGSGTVGGSVSLSGTVSPGGTTNTTATLTTGGFTFNGSSSYRIEMNNATGTSGNANGWDRITSTGSITCSASPITLNLVSLSVVNFNPANSYTWPIASGSSVSGFNTSNFTINTAGFVAFTGTFAVTLTGGNTINLVYSPPSSAPAQPSAIAGLANVCNGTLQTYSVTNDVNATSYTWTLPGGWTGSSTTNSITVTVAAPGGSISVVANNASGSSLPSSLVVSVGVSTAITTQPSSSAQSVCLGSSATPLSVVAEGGSLTYQWYSNSTPSNSGGTLISGATSASYTPVYVGGSPMYYYCIVGGNCAPTSVTSNVSGAVTISGLPNDTTTYTISNGINGGQGFGAWSFQVSGGSGGTFTGGSDIGQAWGIWSQGGLTSAVRPFAAPLSIGNNISFAFDNGGIETNGNKVGVRLRNSSNDILSEFRFIGGATQYSIFDGTGSGVNDTGVNFTTSGLSNITFSYTGPNTYSISITRSGVTTILNGRTFAAAVGGQVPAQIEFFNSNAGGGSARDVFFNNLRIGAPTLLSQPSTSAQSVCVGGSSASLSVQASGTNLGYQWYSNPGANLISGATSSTFSPPTTTAGTSSYYCEVSYTGTCGTAPSVTSGSSGTVTVLGLPTATISGTATVCQNAPATVTFTGSNGTSPYEFQYIVSDGISPPTAQTITTTVGNSVSLTVPTSALGSISYELVGVSSNIGSTPSCSANAVGTATITINSSSTFYTDADGDTYGNLAAPVISCDGTGLPPNGSVTDATDCDDNDPSAHEKFSFYVDADGDTFGTGNLVEVCAVDAMSPPIGFSSINTDCDDADPSKTVTYPFFVDQDTDGYGAGSLVQVCTLSQFLPPVGFSLSNTDCDDNDPLKFTTYTFHIDGDNDTFGSSSTGLACATDNMSPPAGFSNDSNDCDDSNPLKTVNYLYYADIDGDTYGGTTSELFCTENATSPPTGYSTNNTDCDDNDETKFNLFSFYEDLDGDSYGAGAPTLVCGESSVTPPAGYSLDGTDCDDSDDTIYRSTPLYTDLDGDGHDDLLVPGPLCYGASLPPGTSLTTLGRDCDDTNPLIFRSAILFTDIDGDGYDVGSAEVCYGINLPLGTSLSTSGTDCDDTNPSIYQFATFFVDTDGDGYTLGTASICSGATVPSGYSATSNGTDCDDLNPAIYRSATLYTDADNDTYTVGIGSTVCYGADLPAGTSLTASSAEDCDDLDSGIYRSATLYTDADGDTYTVGSGSVVCYGLVLPPGTALVSSGSEDCDDLDPSIYRAATLFTDVDGDNYTVGAGSLACYGATLPVGTSLGQSETEDCDDSNSAIYRSASLYTDLDGDTFTVGAASTVCYGATQPAGTSLVSTGSDCDDANPAVSAAFSAYSDNDNDGFGAGAPTSVCAAVDCSSNTIAVNFRVDMTGQTIGAGGVRVAGNFATRGSTTITSDWSPGATGSQLRPIGNNIYELTVLFPASSAGSSLEFKFLRNNVWSDGANQFSEQTTPGTCSSSGNRLLVLPSKLISFITLYEQCPSTIQGFVCNNTDCDDNNAAIYTSGVAYVDVDGDGYTVGQPTTICFGATGGSDTSLGEDCDDTNPAIYQTAELYQDNDNDGFGVSSTAVVCSPVSCESNTIAVTFRVDMTGQTIGVGGVHVAGNFATRGSTTITSDWNPSAAGSQMRLIGNNIYELTVLFPATSAGTSLEYKFLRNNIWSDGTEYSEQSISNACGNGGNRVLVLPAKLLSVNTAFSQCPSSVTSFVCTNNTDCNDNDATKNTTFPFYADADGDSYGAGNAVSVCAVNATTPPTGYSLSSTDCDDTIASVYQFATFFVDNDGDGYDLGSASVCSGVNTPAGYSATTSGTDCDDNDATKNSIFSFYVDLDGDSYGSGALVSVCVLNATTPPSGYSLNNTDCDDGGSGTAGSHWELRTYFIDSDGDGYDAGSASVCSGLGTPAGYSATTSGTDCDDNNIAIYRSATLYTDLDGDTYTVGTGSTVCYGATLPPGTTLNASVEDCDDLDGTKFQSSLLYVDLDGDGYSPGPATPVCYGATVPSGYTASILFMEECDDNNSLVWRTSVVYTDADGDTYTVGGGISVCYGASLPPGTTLTQSGSDDCDDSNATTFRTDYLDLDADGDEWSGGVSTSLVCYGATAPAGYVLVSLGADCDDTDADLTDNCVTGSVVNLKLFIQGYYTGGSSMTSVRLNQWDGVTAEPSSTEVEELTVELHDAVDYSLVDTAMGTLQTDGTLSVTFNAAAAGSYYIVVKGRNLVQTWSSTAQTIGSTSLSYDFSTSASQAYGDNMIEVESGVFAMYQGDFAIDDLVDLTDYGVWEVKYLDFAFGAEPTDLNGDGLVDLTDYGIWESNYLNFVFAAYPF